MLLYDQVVKCGYVFGWLRHGSIIVGTSDCSDVYRYQREATSMGEGSHISTHENSSGCMPLQLGALFHPARLFGPHGTD